MTIVVFAGPSLSRADVQRLLPEAEFCGPARCGDLYRAVQRGARVIGLIDGYFDHALSVWHKEILWGLSRGVRIYGAASMGALRAAELARYGMRGVGEIYEQFASGRLEDDDEVAVIHEPEERGFRARSEAMVNLRATLASAVADGALEAPAANVLLDALKGMFYPRRELAAVNRLGAEHLSHTDAARLHAWLSAHGVTNQKHVDAVSLLKTMASELASPPRPAPAESTFQFADTDAWRTLRARLDAELTSSERPLAASPAPKAASGARAQLELRSESDVMRLAATRALALQLAESRGSSVPLPVAQAASETFRRERGLLTPEGTARFLEGAGLDLQDFSRLIHDNVLCDRFADEADAMIERQVPIALLVLALLGGSSRS